LCPCWIGALMAQFIALSWWVWRYRFVFQKVIAILRQRWPMNRKPRAPGTYPNFQAASFSRNELFSFSRWKGGPTRLEPPLYVGMNTAIPVARRAFRRRPIHSPGKRPGWLLAAQSRSFRPHQVGQRSGLHFAHPLAALNLHRDFARALRD
jgi:hypothetical protein